jgi:hypothetical protein
LIATKRSPGSALRLSIETPLARHAALLAPPVARTTSSERQSAVLAAVI